MARHGALRGIEADLNTPPQVRRLVRIARFGTRQPRVPDYAAAFQEIGPAAIKLGQTLATRPDLVGDEAGPLSSQAVAYRHETGRRGRLRPPVTAAAARHGS